MIKKCIVVGAGSAGKILANELLNHERLRNNYEIVGFIDDNKNIKPFYNINVIGSIEEIDSIVKKFNIDTVFIAIPSASRELIERIFSNLSKVSVKVKIVPGLYEIIEGSFNFKQIRDFDPVDLLGREEVGLDKDKLNRYYKGKSVIVSGGGGSIGSTIVKFLLKLNIKKLIIFGHGENSIFEVIQKYNDKRLIPYIADIKDKDKLDSILIKEKPDIFIHTAAHKHVPLMEDFPDEAIKNNIFGTYNCIITAIKNRVKNFIFVSTDKAVNPINIMGLTKNIGERIVLSFNNIQKNTTFSVVRFGNVLGSRGSVLNIFKMQLENNLPLTVTHPEMTRYFMSLSEAAKLVLKAAFLNNGNIYILDMGKPIKIIDLAKKIIKIYSNKFDLYDFSEDKIVITGIRRGEKLNEQLFYKNDILKKTIFKKIFALEKKDNLLSEKEILNMLDQFNNALKKGNSNNLIELLKKYSY